MYALTNDPIIFDSLVKQFWSTATLRSPELGPSAILATIDETPYTITEDSLRSQLQLADDGGIADLPIAEIYSGMDNLGYVTEGKLTFYKNKFSPQWRFLVHTILYCLSTKSGSWALICPRFLMGCKLFANMKLNFEGHPMQLLAAMLPQDQEGAGAGHGQSSDPNIASFSRVHETDDDPFTSTNVEDEPLGGSFHASLPRSTQAPPAVFTLVQKVNSLETELKDTKKLFKDV
ncbi:hypothetical protein Tco_0616049, partial [Tanacetum coccineum]